MRAVQIRHFGGYEELEVVERPTPEPGPGQVVIRVRASGVTLSDALIRRDRYTESPSLPLVLGNEVAGTVHDLGAGVQGIRVGARVAAPLFLSPQSSGGYADYATVDAGFVVPIPDQLPYDQATALLVQGLTALHLTRQVSPQGKRVLISAAGGGVGSLLVQLAKRAGATTVIAGASSPEKLQLASSVGADVTVDYSQPGWATRVQWATGGTGPDVIYESVGGAVTRSSLELLAPGGSLVLFGALDVRSADLLVPELLRLISRNQSLTGFAVAPLLTPQTLQTSLRELFDLAVRGDLQVTVGGRYPLERAPDAHRALEERATLGKLVLVP